MKKHVIEAAKGLREKGSSHRTSGLIWLVLAIISLLALADAVGGLEVLLGLGLFSQGWLAHEHFIMYTNHIRSAEAAEFMAEALEEEDTDEH